MSELLPCPFCGKSDFLVEQLDSDASVVICQAMVDQYSACLARGPVGVQESECEDQPGKDAAIREWNRRALLAQPADQQGEPVAYADPKAFQNFTSGIATHEWMWAFSDNGLVPLYLHAQPAAAKVVLPERQKHYENREPGRQPYQNGTIDGWNACLDEVAKLNTPQ